MQDWKKRSPNSDFAGELGFSSFFEKVEICCGTNPAAYFRHRLFKEKKDVRFSPKAKCPNLLGESGGNHFESKR